MEGECYEWGSALGGRRGPEAKWTLGVQPSADRSALGTYTHDWGRTWLCTKTKNNGLRCCNGPNAFMLMYAGYIGSVSFLETIKRLLELLRQYNPDLIYGVLAVPLQCL